MSSKQAEVERRAEPAPGVPVVVLTQFLAALRAKDFTGAKVLAFRSAVPDLETHTCERGDVCPGQAGTANRQWQQECTEASVVAQGTFRPAALICRALLLVARGQGRQGRWRGRFAVSPAARLVLH